MKVSFELRRTQPHPATALLVPDVEAVVRVMPRLGRGWPAIHAVSTGFLVRLPAPTEGPVPGAIRLRALAANLYLPVDAELSPALLGEEAEALTHTRGLVFLPGGRTLAFDLARRLAPGELLTIPRLDQRGWQPLVLPTKRPTQLREIVLDVPPLDAETLLADLDEGVGGDPVSNTEGPTPSGQESTGKALAKLGAGMMWLGSKLRWKGLAGLGAGLIGKAMQLAPRVSEAVLGKQEAALRELLRRFREGKVEDALRRALPLGPASGRGNTIAQNADLPTHNPGYRLSDFLGPQTGGSAWLGGGSIYDELQAEYRKAAEEAERRGDFLRAAVIYGKLLRDWLRMASILSSAGMHRDAAQVYLLLVLDPSQAAREFELAGEFDRALEIYRQRGQHLQAGDLLRRIGETERAVEEYVAAADSEAARKNYMAAARLLCDRAKRSDLAEGYLDAGWKTRPGAEASTCLLELLGMHTGTANVGKVLRLVEDAERYYQEPGEIYAAGLFWNRLSQLARKPGLEAVCEDLRDRALVGIARKLEQCGKEGDRSGAMSMLFGHQTDWEPGLVRDADYAVRGLERKREERRAYRRIPTHRGAVTAGCFRVKGGLFLGFEDGMMLHYHPGSDALVRQAGEGKVVGLSCDVSGKFVVFVRMRDRDTCTLVTWMPDEFHRTREMHMWKLGGVPRLTTMAGVSPHRTVVGMWEGSSLDLMAGSGLVRETTIQVGEGFRGALLFGSEDPFRARTAWTQCVLLEANRVRMLTHQNPHATVQSGLPTEVEGPSFQAPLPWVIPSPRIEGLPVVSWWLLARTDLQIATVNEQGQVCWAQLHGRLPGDRPVEGARSRGAVQFRCAAMFGPDQVAGVHVGGVVWFRRYGEELRSEWTTSLMLLDAVACFASLETRELLVVCSEGDVVAIPLPG